jgi:DNA-binding beta-propeller fold protein YncE
MSYRLGDIEYELADAWGALPSGLEYGQIASVAVDRTDRVYVLSRGDHPVVVFDAEGALEQVWDQRFARPHSIHIGPDGNVYVLDRDAHVVQKHSPDGRLLQTVGARNRPSDSGYTADDPVVRKAAGPFNLPAAVAVDENGDMFVADGYGNCRVHRFDATGALLASWGEPGTEGPAEFNLPHGIAIHDGKVLVCDRDNNRIQVFDRNGEFLEMWTGFRQPTSVARGPEGTLYVSEVQNSISILDSEGSVLTKWGGPGTSEGKRLGVAHGIALDSRGNIYVADLRGPGGVHRLERRD